MSATSNAVKLQEAMRKMLRSSQETVRKPKVVRREKFTKAQRHRSTRSARARADRERMTCPPDS